MSVGSGSGSADFGPPGTFPWSSGFPSGPHLSLAGPSGSDKTKQFTDTFSQSGLNFPGPQPCMYAPQVLCSYVSSYISDKLWQTSFPFLPHHSG